ncbi:MAG: nucleoside-diphosphate kinase [Nanoarchaeota archaeon]
MVKEQTLVVLKPDSVSRSLVGEIITRFEKTGLKIAAMKMVWVDEAFAKKHYFLDEQWAKNVFEKTKKAKETEGKPFPYKDYMEYGGLIQSWNATFLQEGPVIAMVLQGPHAIEIVRKMVGSTEPRQATPGTIRGDYAMIESYALANTKERVLRNLVHASDSPETAEREIALWFTKKEIHDYSKELDRHF